MGIYKIKILREKFSTKKELNSRKKKESTISTKKKVKLKKKERKHANDQEKK